MKTMLLEFIHNLHFLRPVWLFGIILVVLFSLAFLIKQRASQQWQKVCDPHLLKHLLVVNGKQKSWPVALFFLTGLIAVLAMAGPTWSKQETFVYKETQAYVVILDLSAEMDSSDIQPSRVTRARYKINDLLNIGKDSQFGLIVYAKEPYIISPITEDGKTIQAMLNDVTTSLIPVQGNDLSRALLLAKKLFSQANAKTGEIILLSNGSFPGTALATAKTLKQDGFKLNVLGIGTTKGGPIRDRSGELLHDSSGNIVISKLQRKQLRALAKAGGGNYIDFRNDNSDLPYLLQGLKQHSLQAKHRTKQTYTQWNDQGRWLVLVILPLLCLGFRRGWLERIL